MPIERENKVKITMEPRALVGDMERLDNAILLLDIDGIIADIDHRLPYYSKKDWDKFYGATMAEDAKHIYYNTVAMMAMGVMSAYKQDNVKIMFVTSRPERTRAITKLWLNHHVPRLLPMERVMYMREDEDHRQSHIVKWEAINDLLLDLSNEGKLGETDIYYLDDDWKNIEYVCRKCDETQHLNGSVHMFGLVVGTRLLPHPTNLNIQRCEACAAKSCAQNNTDEE